MNIFNNPKNKNNGKFTINGFLIVVTFKISSEMSENKTLIPPSNKIVEYIKSNSLVFSPLGNLYVNEECVFYNPVTDKTREYFSVNWEPIVESKYYSFNTSVPYPHYYISNGGGWILFDNTNTDGNVYLLYNPINRKEFKWDANTFGNYCNIVEFQDPGCYCANYPNQPKKCSFAYLNGENNAKAVLDQPFSNAQNEAAIQSINSQCGCNSLCSNWISNRHQGSPVSMWQEIDCSKIQNLTFCGVGLSAENQSKLELGGLTVVQNCNTSSDNNIQQPTKTEPTKTEPTKTEPKKTESDTNKTFIIIGIILLFLIIIVIINVFK
jgi:hypothetical protein